MNHEKIKIRYNKSMNVFMLLLSVALLATGCNRIGNTDQDVGQEISQRRQGVPESNTSMIQFTSYLWSSKDYTYKFFSDGTFRWNVISDYKDERTGRWGFKQLSRGDGLLFLLWSSKKEFGSNAIERADVLYFRYIAANKLQLAGHGIELINQTTDRGRQTHPEKLADIINRENFPDYFSVTTHSWKKIGTKDSTFVPDYFLFQQDGTFIARYRNGECDHGGHWSLKGSQLYLEMPPEHCDTRGYNKAVLWGQTYTFEGDFLVFDQQYKFTPQ